MVNYSYERCGKEFSQKSHYDSHKKRKRPCENNVDKIKELVDKAVEEKLKEINKINKNDKKEVISKMTDMDKIKTPIDNKTSIKLQKPFIKWVGGKTQIIDKIIDKFPKEINNYHELFLGGGSVLLAILTLVKNNKINVNGNIYAYDINPILINVYKNIQNNKDKLVKLVLKYKKEYSNLTGSLINRKPKDINEANTSKESYYYWIRDKFNKMDVKTSLEGSALFIFLNKTCFRGMYREGPNGFNVPYGHYKKTPEFITETEINNISDLIKDVVFETNDFSESIKNIKEGDYVYLDPPYAPIDDNSFVSYTKDGFGIDKHKQLFEEIINLGKNKVKFTMSNAKVDLVTNYFKDFKCEDILARRAINSKKPESTAIEVIVWN